MADGEWTGGYLGSGCDCMCCFVRAAGRTAREVDSPDRKCSTIARDGRDPVTGQFA